MVAMPRRVVRGTLLLAAATVVLLIVSAIFRGPWLDDFATFLFANPAVPWGVAWHNLWPTDINPPLFYAVARLWVDLCGTGLWARRMVNILPLLGLLGWFGVAWRRFPAQRAFLLLYWLIGICSAYFFSDFSVYRSYFFQYVAALVFVGAATLNYLEQRREIDWFQLAAVPFLFELHQITALYAGVMLLALIGRDLRARNWPRGLTTGGVALVSGVPLLVVTWLQLHRQVTALDNQAWIQRHGVWPSLWLILGFLPKALGQNWLALSGGLVALFNGYVDRPARRWLWLLAGMAFVGTGLLLIANCFTPLIVDRYFAFLTVLCVCGLTLALVALCARFVWLFYALLAFAAVYTGVCFVQAVRDQRWSQGADMVANLVAQCPGTRVHAGMMPPNPEEQIGLAFLAAQRGVTLLPVVPGHVGTGAGACPVLYWTEYYPPSNADVAYWRGDLARAANAHAGWGLSGDALARATAARTRDGVIVILPP